MPTQEEIKPWDLVLHYRVRQEAKKSEVTTWSRGSLVGKARDGKELDRCCKKEPRETATGSETEQT